VTAAVADETSAAASRLAAPCVAWDGEHGHCVAGLLYGAACCPDGGCWSCTTQAAWTRRAGFSDYAVFRSVARMRRGMLDRCPVCGFPPPPPSAPRGSLPRFRRVVTAKSGSSGCEICEGPIPRGRRRYCSERCERLRDHHGGRQRARA
jgi:hypothetical protein